MVKIPSVAEQLSTIQKGLGSMELVALLAS
jgi:hypothetical protein